MNKKYRIGEKIRNRRKELNMTQNEVCGDFITRNMLSLIESGSAMPSLESAEYISNRLNLPLSYLFSEEHDLSVFEEKQIIFYIHQAYKNARYEDCINMLEKLSDFDDELNYIYAFASFYKGKELLRNGYLESADKYLNIALKRCEETIYKTDEIKITAPLYLSITSNILSPLLEFDVESYQYSHTKAYDYELFKYVSMDFDYEYENKVFEKHIDAKRRLKQYDYFGAIKLLKEVEELKNSEYNAYVLFGVYTDLENAYKQIGDFKNAYRYASKRITLINAFKS